MEKVCKDNIGCLLESYRDEVRTIDNWMRCAEFSQILDKAGEERGRLNVAKYSAPVGGMWSYFGLDLDSDGKDDEVTESCGSQNMPCQLDIKLSSGNSFELEERRFYVAHDGPETFVVVGDLPNGRQPNTNLDQDIYQISKEGIQLLCRGI
jgi:hypothetical protein